MWLYLIIAAIAFFLFSRRGSGAAQQSTQAGPVRTTGSAGTVTDVRLPWSTGQNVNVVNATKSQTANEFSTWGGVAGFAAKALFGGFSNSTGPRSPNTSGSGSAVTPLGTGSGPDTAGPSLDTSLNFGSLDTSNPVASTAAFTGGVTGSGSDNSGSGLDTSLAWGSQGNADTSNLFGSAPDLSGFLTP